MKIKGAGEAEAWKGGDLIPEGKYVVQCEKADELNSSKGNPYISFDLKVIRGEEKGRHVWENVTVMEKTMGLVRAVLEAFGVAVTNDIDTKDGRVFVGKKAQIVVRHKTEEDNRPEYAGTMRTKARIVAWAPAPKSEDDPLAAAAKDTLGATEEDDDIPF